MAPVTDLSGSEARRVALAAQGFASPRPTRPGLPHARRVLSRLHAVQIDSVNVLARSHYLPLFSRLGPYPAGALDRLAYDRRELFEYWGHAASLLPVTLYPLLRWRMELYGEQNGSWRRDGRDTGYVDAVLDEVAERGPLAASELSDPGHRRGHWWGWADGKAALEWLYSTGRVAVAGRRRFERLYDLTERVIPPSVLEAPPVPADDAKRELLALAARALGVGTATDLADYFHVEVSWWRPKADGKRTPSQLTRLVEELVDAGRLVPARVEGWRQSAYLDPSAKAPTEVRARALVSPFDSLVWERSRTVRLFGFDYRMEIYTPAPKRRYGYYVLPFLLGDTLVARVDLKADRKGGALLVPGAFAEPGTDERVVASELAAELRAMASWLGLRRVEVGERGGLSRRLRRVLQAVGTG